MEKLPGDYIAGFVDGEGCFALIFRRDFKSDRPSQPEYFYWRAEFAIVLREDDREILEKIMHTLECGKIGKTINESVRYYVIDTEDLKNKIVPFFQKYQLRAKKRKDFELWKEALKIIKKNKRTRINAEIGKDGFQKITWNHDDLVRLRKIQEEMKRYKSKSHKDWKWIDKAVKE